MLYLRPVEEWQDGEEGCSAPTIRRRQSQCQTAGGGKNEMGKKESKKRQCERKRDRERKYVSAGKTKTVHKGNTRQTHIAHTGENTNVCNQTEWFQSTDIQHLHSISCFLYNNPMIKSPSEASTQKLGHSRLQRRHEEKFMPIISETKYI